MDWGTFWTIVLQVCIVLILLLFISAFYAAIKDSERKRKN